MTGEARLRSAAIANSYGAPEFCRFAALDMPLARARETAKKCPLESRSPFASRANRSERRFRYVAPRPKSKSTDGRTVQRAGAAPPASDGPITLAVMRFDLQVHSRAHTIF